MTDLERLNFHVGSRLQAYDGILDHLDYRRLRRLGVQLRDIPSPRDDWDIPPSSLQGWIESYAATIESVQISESSGLLALLTEASDEIREVLAIETLPALDAQVVDQKQLEELIDRAKAKDWFKDFDFEHFMESAPSKEEVARALVVQINVSTTWPERPKVDKPAGLKHILIHNFRISL